MLGAYQMTAIYDGLWPLKIEDNFIRNASNAEVEASLAAAFLPPGILQINFTALLVNTGRKLVLIDTGTAGQIVDSAGTLLDNLAVAGIKPAAIDTILISHFHPDHINGIKDRDGRKIFPERGNRRAGCGMGLLDERSEHGRRLADRSQVLPQCAADFP